MEINELNAIQLRDAFKCALIRAKFKRYRLTGSFPTDCEMAELFGVSPVTFSRCLTGVSSPGSLFFYKVLCYVALGSDDRDFTRDLRDILL